MNQMDKILQESVDILRQLDRNTERYMVDELKQEIDELKQSNQKLKFELIESVRDCLINGVSFEIVCDSIKALSEETLQEIYDEVMANKSE